MMTGQRVTWNGVNRTMSGTVIGYHNGFAVVRIQDSTKCILLGPKRMEPQTQAE